jgi:hypothetical protein
MSLCIACLCIACLCIAWLCIACLCIACLCIACLRIPCLCIAWLCIACLCIACLCIAWQFIAFYAIPAYALPVLYTLPETKFWQIGLNTNPISWRADYALYIDLPSPNFDSSRRPCMGMVSMDMASMMLVYMTVACMNMTNKSEAYNSMACLRIHGCGMKFLTQISVREPYLLQLLNHHYHLIITLSIACSRYELYRR